MFSINVPIDTSMKSGAILDEMLLTILFCLYNWLYIVFIHFYKISRIYEINQDIKCHPGSNRPGRTLEQHGNG